MNNKNWYVDLRNCTPEQLDRLVQLYGINIKEANYLGKDAKGNVVLLGFGVEITARVETSPEEAFKRLGLGDQSECIVELTNVIGDRKEDLVRANNRIKQLEQQLAEKSCDIDWSNVAQDLVYLGQHKSDHGVFDFFTSESWNVYKNRYQLIATRPKPKYTDEQIQLTCNAWNDWCAYTDRGGDKPFVTWLKEVNK